MSERDLLVEIGTEELPPKALLTLSQSFHDSLSSLLKGAGLTFSSVEQFATPRRLALLLTGVPERQPDQIIEKTGPALQAAFAADGKPTKAAEGFARSCGVEVSDLGQKEDGKVTKLVFRSQKQGADTVALVPDLVTQALAALPVPKRMRWGSSRDEFVRPVHWIVLLFGEDVINASILGIETGRITRGHRFHCPSPLEIPSPRDYESLLLTGKVIARFNQRRDIIRQQVQDQASLHNGVAEIDDNLLDEVTALVEWPVALTGNFDRDFLGVPKEALTSSMKEHQKCFPLLGSDGGILPHFIAVSNLESRDPAQVVAGNEKVIRPRLADAAFFFRQDQKTPLHGRIEKLKTVVFQQELGTLYDKSCRVRKLAGALTDMLKIDNAAALRAAELGKCDLMTSMVYEFAELQGTMGTYYARHDGEPEEVARALSEQYYPRFAGDQLPETSAGMVLALAERLDTMTGLFGIGQPPTGSKDPFALRRAALGILRIIVEKQLPLDLHACIKAAVANFGNFSDPARTIDDVANFIFERFRAWYSDQGVQSDTFLAVDAVRPSSPLEFDTRILAVNHFRKLPQAAALAAANKRVSNLLQKAEDEIPGTLATALLQEEAESRLASRLEQCRSVVAPLLAGHDFTAALSAMAGLQADVDTFFDKVMVNVEDRAIRINRLALLKQLRDLFLEVADISLLQNV
jgi:glycyl-tRNA synthetase beta chain